MTFSIIGLFGYINMVIGGILIGQGIANKLFWQIPGGGYIVFGAIIAVNGLFCTMIDPWLLSTGQEHLIHLDLS